MSEQSLGNPDAVKSLAARLSEVAWIDRGATTYDEPPLREPIDDAPPLFEDT